MTLALTPTTQWWTPEESYHDQLLKRFVVAVNIAKSEGYGWLIVKRPFIDAMELTLTTNLPDIVVTISIIWRSLSELGYKVQVTTCDGASNIIVVWDHKAWQRYQENHLN
jgi:hypothetical protein